MKKNLLGWLSLVVLLLVGCQADQASKAWASQSLKESPRPVVPGLLEMRYAENRAIAFSMLRDIPEARRKPLIYALAGFSVACLLGYAWIRRRQGWSGQLPIALILAGAFGNLLDRWNHGYVVDFVHVHWQDAWSFPIFNLADSLITVGLGLLFAMEIFSGRRQEREIPAPADESGAQSSAA
jgi:signal peptidase II